MKMSRVLAAFGLLAAAIVGVAYAAPSGSNHDAVPIAQFAQPAMAVHDLMPIAAVFDLTSPPNHAAIAVDLTTYALTNHPAGIAFTRSTRFGLSADAMVEMEKARRFRPPDKSQADIVT